MALYFFDCFKQILCGYFKVCHVYNVYNPVDNMILTGQACGLYCAFT